MTDIKNNIDPRTWSTRNKIIAAVIAAILALTGITVAVIGSQSHNAKDCAAYQELITGKTAQLDQAIQDANDALKTVDASLKAGEGTRLAHTGDFPLSSEGQSAINDLNKAVDAAKKAKEAEDAKVNAATDSKKSKCSSEPDTTSIDAAIKAIKDQTQSFIDVRDAYRLTKATDEANALMDEAKSNLATAQQSATDQLAVVDGDTALQGDTTVKAAYDALKQTEADSHSASTTVTTGTYDEAVASIEKAKTVEQKAAEVTASVASLQEAITAYQDAKAASASNASTTPETSNDNAPSYGYNGGNNSGSNYSGGNSYNPPAPPANNSGPSLDGRITSGPGGTGPSGQTGPLGHDDPNAGHGCLIIEGQTICR